MAPPSFSHLPDPELAVSRPTPLEKAAIMSILSVFETGSPIGDYAARAVLRDGAGISYGLHQLTDGGGNLAECLRRYVAAGGLFASRLAADLPWIESHGSTLEDPDALSDQCLSLLEALGVAADEDPIMRSTQDEVFEDLYFRPSVEAAEALELVEPLSFAVVYDTWIHSGPTGLAKIRRLFPELPPSKGGAEILWTAAYVEARWGWLANHPSGDRVRMTKARPAAFRDLIEAANWRLETPFAVLGVTIPAPAPSSSALS